MYSCLFFFFFNYLIESLLCARQCPYYRFFEYKEWNLTKTSSRTAGMEWRVCCTGKNRSTKHNAAGLHEDKLELESHGLGCLLVFHCGFVCSPFFSLLAFLGHYLCYNGSHWHTQTICPFKLGFPWLTDTYSHQRACGSAQALDDPCGHIGVMLHCLS